jgi:hypothetical protein
MRRIPIAIFLVAAWALAGCATTATPKNNDADAGDMSDLGDTTPDLPDGTDSVMDTAPDLPPDTAPDLVDTAPDSTTGGVVGDACYSASQCGGVPGAGVTCLTSIMGYITFPGGYCSAVCTSAGGECVSLSDLGRYCLKRCTTPTNCRTAEGYGCDPVTGATGTYCIPPFSSPESDY